MEIRFFLGEVLTASSVYPCNGWRWVAGLWGSVCGSAGICCSVLGASPSPLQRAVREEARVFPPNPASCCIPILYVPLLSTWISLDDHDHRALSPRSWTVLLWGSAVQVNQPSPTQLPSTSPSFFYRHRPLPHPFSLRQSASCAVGGASMPIVPRATTENGFQNKSTLDPYGSRLSTFPLHLAS